jgi:hypothetical protein
VKKQKRETPKESALGDELENEQDAPGHAPAPAPQRLRIAMIALFGSVVAFGVFGGFGGTGRSDTSDPEGAIPKGAFIAATADFAELRRSPLYDVVAGKEAAGGSPMRRALGVSALAEACGFDPTTRVQKIAVSVPEDGERGEFGIAARVEVTRDELERCTKALAEKRGGRAETRDVGSFVVLEDKSIGASSSPRLAYGRGGLLVVGKGTWFDAMLGAADRTMPAMRDGQEHVTLRKALTSRDGFHAPTILITAILPRSLRERLKGEMEAEASAHELSHAAMAGVLGVSAVGIALHTGGAGQNIDASIELLCDDTAACEAIDKLLKKKLTEWSGDLALRMLGLGPLLDSFEVKLEGARLRATATVRADALAASLDRLMKLRARGPADTPPSTPPRRAEPKRPDETIPARPDGR